MDKMVVSEAVQVPRSVALGSERIECFPAALAKAKYEVFAREEENKVKAVAPTKEAEVRVPVRLPVSGFTRSRQPFAASRITITPNRAS